MRIDRVALLVSVTREQLPHVRRDPRVGQLAHVTMPQAVERVAVELMAGLAAGGNRHLLNLRLRKDGVKLDAHPRSNEIARVVHLAERR